MKGVNLTMANAQTVVLTTKHAQDTKVSEIDTSKLLTFVFFQLLWLKICPACANDLEAKGTRSRKLLPKPQNHQVRRENIKIPTNDSQPDSPIFAALASLREILRDSGAALNAGIFVVNPKWLQLDEIFSSFLALPSSIACFSVSAHASASTLSTHCQSPSM